ncbi:unnamed protein product [Macrosiphum euphorbiae]|uniref:Uncharacterized protein n=1 Tax=Macrosiphum euphorbiae TaxID=13131 RepID=A0AAV0Y1P0_9HEMI|nr:unnamed protein product [Macrosiphum euphorbiae]
MATILPKIGFINDKQINELIQNVSDEVIDESVIETSDVIDAFINEMLDDVIDEIVTSDDKYLQDESDMETSDVIDAFINEMLDDVIDEILTSDDAPSTELQPKWTWKWVKRVVRGICSFRGSRS